MREKYQSVVIEVCLEKDLLEQLAHLKNSPVLKNAEKVHLVHIYNQKSDACLPLDIKSQDRDAIQKYIAKLLEETKERLMHEGAKEENWFTQVLLHNDAKLEATKFLSEVGADLVITVTHHSSGPSIFRDSFSYFLLENAPCDVYVLRPVH